MPFLWMLFIPLFLTATSFEDKVGALIIMGFRGMSLDEAPELKMQLDKHAIGGIILYDWDSPHQNNDRNIQSPEQLHSLCHALSTYPIWIAIDQEGGKVNRLHPTYGFPSTLSQEALAEDPAQNLKQAHQTAALLHDLGINLNFAPVVDLLRERKSDVMAKSGRCFGADPNSVTDLARMVVDAHHSHGVACCLKHFPGHGSAMGDTHMGFVDVTQTWQSDELEPYKALLNTDMVMTAHVFHAHLDAQYPATLSKAIIQGLLRETLGYQGIVITDDLGMKAVSAHYSLKERVKLALNAGVDLLLFGNQHEYDPQIGSSVKALILQLVEEGEVAPARIEEAYQRTRRT